MLSDELIEMDVNRATRVVIGTTFPWLLNLLPEDVRTLQIVEGINLATLGIEPEIRRDALGGRDYPIGRVFVLDGEGALLINVGLYHVTEPAFLWAKERQVERWCQENLWEALLRFSDRALQMRYVVHLFDDQAVLYRLPATERIHSVDGWIREKRTEAHLDFVHALKPRR